jgi:alginate O-acetyltransferase complex protein AlgI
VLFNSYQFVLAFLPLVLAGFFLIRRQRPRLVLLVAASYVFYAYADHWLPILMLGSTAVSYTAGRLLAAERFASRRKLIVAIGVVGLLSLLAYFKYAEFVAGYSASFVQLITGTGLPGLREFTHGILLPIGISFYTFEGISYVVDVYRKTIPAESDPLRYALFISFFPHLIAGPIVRYGKLGPQLHGFYRLDPELLRSGVLLFSLGLAKKVLLADGIAHYVNPLLAAPGALGFFTAWGAMLGFAFQIYLDFSGYTDMALGLARMFGIELPWNFDRPYRAADPREFWRRWHVTLSTWLRDYLYIPLGGNRKGERRRDVNLLATMGLGGLWHGASVNFVIWGLYHGLLLTLSHHFGGAWERLGRRGAVAFTFLLVTIGWVFFRMKTFGDTVNVFVALSGARGGREVPGRLLLYVFVAAILMWTTQEEWRWNLPRWGMLRVAALAALTAVTVTSLDLTHPFIYFKF